jgi:hypothetical protein
MRREDYTAGKPIISKRRGQRTALAGMAALGVLVLVLTLSTLANRPRWHTITLTDRPGNATVAFDCPDDWVVVDRHLEVISASDDIARITLRRDPPTGWLRWWNTHVAHLSEHPFNSPEIEVEVLAAKGLETHPVLRVKFDTSMAGTSIAIADYSRNTKRVSHPMGSAVHRTVDINLNTPGRGTPGGKTWLPRHIEALDIYPSEPKGQHIGLVTVSCAAPTEQYPQIKPLFDRLMQSVRLVKKETTKP